MAADPWESPLSSKTLEATSQASEPSTAVATDPTPPPLDMASKALVAPTSATAATPLTPPTVSVSTDGRERTLVLAIPIDAERVPAEQLPPSVIYTSGLLQNLGPFEFSAADYVELPRPAVAFEPPAARFEEVSAVALSAVDQLVQDGLASSYPAKLEDISMPTKLNDATAFTPGSIPSDQTGHTVWAPAMAEQRAAVQFAEAATASQAQPSQETGALPQKEGNLSTSGAQQLARLDIADRLPGPPLAAAALAQVSAFDASRTMQSFEVTGKAALARPIIDDALKAFLGAERTDEQLQAARSALQRAHDVNGQRVKVILGEQRERDGIARFEVRELKRYSLRIAGELRYDPVTRRNVRADVNVEHDEPLPNLTLSRKLSLK